MPTKNIFLNSIKQSFLSIWKNKFLFALLFILQIIFFIIFSLISYNYIPKILESAKSIADYLKNQQFNEVTATKDILEQKSILGDDPLLISRKINDIVKNFKVYLANIFIFLIVFTSISWLITHKLIYRNNIKNLLKISLKIFIVSLFYFGLIFTFFYSLMSISLIQIASEGLQLLYKYIPFLIFSIVLAYFMFISLSIAHKTELKNIVQKTLVIGIRKIHYVLAVYSIDFILFFISIYLLLEFLEKNIFVLFLSMILLIFSFVFGRIFLINVVERLES